MPNIARLQHLRNIIAEKDADLINMEQWKCGTQACALGWAAMDPFFNNLGLHFDWGLDMWGKEFRPVPTYEGMTMYKAAANFFNIDDWQAIDLFDPITDAEIDEHGSSVTDKEIFLIRLDNFLKEHINGEQP